MREIGASDAFLYMTNTGRGYTMEIQMDIVLSEPANISALQRAADETMLLFPEFSAQLVIQNGRLMYRENNRPVRIILTDDPAGITVNYCTDDTNGHVFYLFADSRDLRKVTLSYLHGMSDYSGGMMMLKTLLYRYQLIVSPGKSVLPDVLAAAGIRGAVPDDWDRPENIDPYNCCGTEQSNCAAVTNEVPFSVEGLRLYPVGTEVNHIWQVTTDSRAFLAKCREIGTSFAPLIINTLIDTVAECFDMKDETVAVSLPVDMRPVFGISTATNFSDGVIISLDSKQRGLSTGERCALLKESINEQRTSRYLGTALAAKAHSVRDMLNDPEGFIGLADRMMAPILSGVPRKVPMTFVATYPGKTDLPVCLNGLVKSIMPVSVMGKIKFYFLVSTFENTMTLQVIQRFDDDCLPRVLVEKLEKMELEASVADMGLRRQGCLQPEKLAFID